jgi:hypothetical protein
MPDAIRREGLESHLGLLVGFRSSDPENKSVGILLDVVNIESDDFAAAQCAGEAEQYERSIAYFDKSIAEWLDERGDRCQSRPDRRRIVGGLEGSEIRCNGQRLGGQRVETSATADSDVRLA